MAPGSLCLYLFRAMWNTESRSVVTQTHRSLPDQWDHSLFLCFMNGVLCYNLNVVSFCKMFLFLFVVAVSVVGFISLVSAQKFRNVSKDISH